MSGIKALDKLRESSHLDDNKWTLETGEVVNCFGSDPNDPNAVNWGEQWRRIADEIEREVDDLIDDMGMVSVDGYEVPFNTPDALHMVLGAAADRFDTPEDAVRYLQGETSMLLPVDSDGVPICVGDHMRSVGTDKHGVVCGVGENSFHLGDSAYGYNPEAFRHVKPRTLEYVLEEYYDKREWDEADNHALEAESLTAQYAAEIRELLRGDAE